MVTHTFASNSRSPPSMATPPRSAASPLVGFLPFPRARQDHPKGTGKRSVHPIPDIVRRGQGGGSLRVFKPFVLLEVGSIKGALSRPAHQYPEGT